MMAVAFSLDRYGDMIQDYVLNARLCGATTLGTKLLPTGNLALHLQVQSLSPLLSGTCQSSMAVHKYAAGGLQ